MALAVAFSTAVAPVWLVGTAEHARAAAAGAPAAAPSPPPPPAPSAEGQRKPYHRIERKESELHRKLAGRRPDFGPGDPISRAWAQRKISLDEYIDLSLRRIAKPDDLPPEYRPKGRLPSSAGLALGYALSLREQRSPRRAPSADEAAFIVTRVPAASAASASWPDCATDDWHFALHTFDCRRSFTLQSKEFHVHYNLQGISGAEGVPTADSDANGVPDVIDTFVDRLSKAWTAYRSWGYDMPGNYVSVYFGFDYNDNPGLTLPFGDHILNPSEGSVIVLPTAPPLERYTYLAYHELFHVMQYNLIQLNVMTLPSVNWWMEATAEWATHRMYELTGPADPGWDIYSSAVDRFLGAPQKALTSSTWPWEAHKRQYGAFLLPQYLTEQTDQDFVLHSWEAMDETRLPLEGITDAVEGYGLSMHDLLIGFWTANYRLSADTPDLSAFLGAPVGYRDPDAATLWPNSLPQGRPSRAVERTLLWDGTADGSIENAAGGASYLEFTGPSLGESVLTLHVEQHDGPNSFPNAKEAEYLLVSWPAVGGRPSSTPSRWTRRSGDGDLSITLGPDEIATLIVVRTDLVADSGYADASLLEIEWHAAMEKGGPRLNSALNGMWSAAASSAGCADWGGGEAAQSIPLPGGDRAWFFADTFLGRPGTSGAEVGYVRNSIVVQQGSTLRTITGGSTCGEAGSGADLGDGYVRTPVGEGGQYWPGDAKALNVNVSVAEMVKFYYEGTGDENTRGAYARFTYDDLRTKTTMNVTPTGLPDCSARPPYPIIWGAAIVDHDGMTYIYGWEANGASAEKPLYLARTADTADPVDLSRWMYFAGTAADGSAQWRPTCAESKPLGVKSEVDFSVIHIDGRFWLVHHTPAGAAPGKIVGVPARTAWGFGSEQVELYTPPETRTGPVYSSVYGARVHPGLGSGSGRVVISYTVRTSATDLTCLPRGQAFPDGYTPRFIDVPASAFFSAKT